MNSSSILRESLVDAMRAMRDDIQIEYKAAKHFKDRMSQRGINLKEINNLIENGIIEQAKGDRKKEYCDGLVVVYSIKQKVKTLITCYRSNNKEHNLI